MGSRLSCNARIRRRRRRHPALAAAGFIAAALAVSAAEHLDD